MAKNGDAKLPGPYSVGYGKPPEHSRFRKGQSGNPHGRPKGRLNIASVLLKTLREKVTIEEDGKHRTMTKLEASMKQLVNKAASGDLRALCFLVGITREAEQSASEQAGAKDVLNDLDKKVLMNIIQRYANSTNGVKQDETPDD
jgi:hypothetical protein